MAETHQNDIYGAVLSDEFVEFNQRTARMAAIAIYAVDAPDVDKVYHETALLNAYKHTVDFLCHKPEIHRVYETIGEVAMKQSPEDTQLQLDSSTRLLEYVRDGLLDSLTIEELEERITLLQVTLETGEYIDIFNELFVQNIAPTNQEDNVVKSQSKEEITAVLREAKYDKATLAVVEAAMKGPVRLEELRRELEPLSNMTDEEYGNFKYEFANVRNNIEVLLKTSGLSVMWHITGKARGTRYELVAVSSVEQGANLAMSPDKDNDDVNDTITREQIAAARFTRGLLNSIRFMINEEDQSFRAKRNYITREVAKWLDEDVSVAEGLIDDLIAADLLFVVGRSRGSDILAVEQPDQPILPRQRQRRTVTKTQETDAKTFSSDEVDFARTICTLILESRSKRISKADIVSRLGLDETEGRRFINKLIKSKLVTSQKGWERGRSKTHRKETVFVVFPSSNAATHFKENPEDYLNTLTLVK